MDTTYTVGILFQIIDKLSRPVGKIKKIVDDVKKPVEKINKQVDKISGASTKAGRGFDKTKNSVNRLTEALGRTVKKVKSVVKNSEELKKKFDTLRNKSMGMAAAGGLITAPFVGLTLKAMNFGEGLSNVSTMLNMTVGEVREKYNKEILKLAVDVGQSPDIITEAMYQGLSAGVSADEIMDSLYTAGRASVGGRTGITEAIDGLTTVVNTYGSDVLNLKQTSDLMFTAVKLGKTTFGELSRSLFNVLPSASGIGIKFHEVTAALAALTAQGVPTSVATTRIRASIDELSKETGKTSKIFKELSGVSFREFIKGGGDLQQAMMMLEEHAEENNIGINNLFSSVEAGGAALMLTGKGTKKFTDALKEMEKSAGATGEAFDKMTSEENVKFRWDQFKASLSAISIILGQILLPSFNKLLTGVNKVLSVVQKFSSEHPVLAKSIMFPIAALGILLTVLGAVGTVVGVVGGGLMNLIKTIRILKKLSWVAGGGITKMVKTIKTLKKMVGMVNLAFLSSPIFWIIAGIVLLIVVGYLLIKNWDKVKKFFIDMWQKIVGAFTRAWNFIRGLLDRTPGWLLGVIAVFMPFIGIPALIIKYWDVLKPYFMMIVSFFKGVFGGLVACVLWVRDNWKKLLNIFLWVNPLTFPIMVIKKLISFLRSINLFEAGANILRSLVDGIKSMIMAPVDAVRGVVEAISDFLPHSPAKTGPLADLDKTGTGLMDTIAGGITALPVIKKLSPVMQRIGELLGFDSPTGMTEKENRPMGMTAPALAGAGINITIQYNPVINAEKPEEIEGILQKNSEDLRQLILDTIKKAHEQEERRAY